MVGRIETGLERAEHRGMELGGGAIRDIGAAMAVVDGGEQPVRRRLDRPAVFHVIAEPGVGGDADPGRQGGHGFARAGRSRRELPAHSATSSLSSMMT